MSTNNPLEVTEIVTPENSGINKGEEHKILYKIVNNGLYPVRDIRLQAFTVHEDGKPSDINYVTKISGMQETVLGGQHFNVEVTVKIPDDYNITFMHKSGIKAIRPIDVEFNISGRQYVTSQGL